MNKKIAVVTDMSFMGSGYFYIFTNLAKGLADLGYQITVAGLGYMGEPHDFPFSVIPCPMLQDAVSIVNNLIYLQKADMILVAMDIPIQMQMQASLASLNKPYIAITPMENGPLVDEWAMGLSKINHVWMISEMAKQEAVLAGLKNVDHLYVGVDTDLWHIPTPEERKQLRQGLGFEEDEIVILTVADNQERKNLWAGMRIVGELRKKKPDLKFKYVMVTKEESPVGWRLRSLAKDEKLVKEFIPFQRGMPTRDLWGLYACADIYLQPSKAEGLGLPVMEAMACGVPCVATDTGALPELLQDGRGKLVPPIVMYIDVWGNSRRHLIDIDRGAQIVSDLLDNKEEQEKIRQAALAYVQERTWDIPVKQVDTRIQEIFSDPKYQTEAQAGSK